MALYFSSLASGSSGNCQLIKSNHTTLLLDAGLTGKYISQALGHYDIALDSVDGIVVTHEHSDHIAGLGVVHRMANLPLYMNEKTWCEVKDKIGKVDASKVNIIDSEKSFAVGDIVVSPQRVSHDAADPLCFTFAQNNTKIAIITDLGKVDDAIVDIVSDVNLVMLEANHNVEMLMSGAYPYPLKRRVAGEKGHLSNEVCAEVAIKAIESGRLSTILLAHLSRENNTPELAYQTVKSMMLEKGIVVGKDIMLDLTYRNRTGNFYRLDR